MLRVSREAFLIPLSLYMHTFIADVVLLHSTLDLSSGETCLHHTSSSPPLCALLCLALRHAVSRIERPPFRIKLRIWHRRLIFGRRTKLLLRLLPDHPPLPGRPRRGGKQGRLRQRWWPDPWHPRFDAVTGPNILPPSQRSFTLGLTTAEVISRQNRTLWPRRRDRRSPLSVATPPAACRLRRRGIVDGRGRICAP